MLIGVTGRAGEGKTSIAKHLEKNHGFSILSFSTHLKRAVAPLFDIPMVNLLDPKLKEQIIPRWGKTAREILQIFASGCMRNHFDQDFWVKKLESDFINNSHKHVVIDDVRFKNEIDFIFKWGNGHLIHVTRPDNPYQIDQNHISEQAAYSGYPIIEIVNDTTLKELGNKVDDLMNMGDSLWENVT